MSALYYKFYLFIYLFIFFLALTRESWTYRIRLEWFWWQCTIQRCPFHYKNDGARDSWP